MYRRSLNGLSLSGLAMLGLATLSVVTSCVPADGRHDLSVRDRPVADARTLLKDLALTVPKDVLVDLPPASSALKDHASSAGRIAPPFLAQPQTLDDGRRALDCLTAAVYYEARSQTVDGQRAVAQVVLNRVRDRAFPNSICGVVYQGSQRRTGCQFSFTCDGSMLRPREPGAWDRARAVAQDALSGAVYAPVGTATFYHATSVMPWWVPSLSRVAMIGSHIFYRWQGALGNALAFRQRYAGWEPAPGSGMTATYAVAHDAVGDNFAVTVRRGTDAGAPVAIGMTTVSGVRVHYGIAPAPPPDLASAPAEEDSPMPGQVTRS